MIARARANADRPGNGDQRRPSFLVGDVAALAFPDGSFDLVVSTLSMHHWADPAAGLAEIGRVLRPGGRVLIWDFRPGTRPHPFGPRHAHLPDPAEHLRGGPLRMVNARHGAGPGGSPSPSGSSWSTPMAHPDTPDHRATPTEARLAAPEWCPARTHGVSA
jgi:SAM-dependent methyltransferase